MARDPLNPVKKLLHRMLAAERISKILDLYFKPILLGNQGKLLKGMDEDSFILGYLAGAMTAVCECERMTVTADKLELLLFVLGTYFNGLSNAEALILEFEERINRGDKTFRDAMVFGAQETKPVYKALKKQGDTALTEAENPLRLLSLYLKEYYTF